jgi:hypothetical protein
MLTNWARDKGFGMGKVVGYIPAPIGGLRRKLAHVGTIFSITPQNMKCWNEWWRIIRVDQYVIFFFFFSARYWVWFCRRYFTPVLSLPKQYPQVWQWPLNLLG